MNCTMINQHFSIKITWCWYPLELPCQHFSLNMSDIRKAENCQNFLLFTLSLSLSLSLSLKFYMLYYFVRQKSSQNNRQVLASVAKPSPTLCRRSHTHRNLDSAICTIRKISDTNAIACDINKTISRLNCENMISHEGRETRTVVGQSHVRLSHDCREMHARMSHDCRKTLARMSHDYSASVVNNIEFVS